MEVKPLYAALVFQSRRVLLLRTEAVGGYGGGYELPTARPSEEEEVRKALARTVKERTGVAVPPDELQPTSSEYRASVSTETDKVELTLHVFTTCSFEGSTDPHKTPEPVWIDPAEVELSEDLNRILRDVEDS